MQQRLAELKPKYVSGAYDKCDGTEQWIRITDGCPHNCPYCYAPQKREYYGIPEIKRNKVKIMDMNLLSNRKAIGIMHKLRNLRVNNRVIEYDFICGLDWRFINQDIAGRIKSLRVKKIRMAWDWYYRDQLKIKDAVDCFLKIGYRPKAIMIFMICNWRIPYEECCLKLELLKVWGLQVSDCYYDNQTSPGIIPIHWTAEEIKTFRRSFRRHNKLVTFKYDPEVAK